MFDLYVKLLKGCKYSPMQTDQFRKARLTIHECGFPQNQQRQRVSSNIKKISFAQISSSLERKHLQNNSENNTARKIARILKTQRKSEPQYLTKDQFMSNLMNLPEIRAKTKVQENKETIEPIKSYSSAKLSLGGPYRKIEGVYSSRYSSKIESLKKIEPSPYRKVITISQLNGVEIASPEKIYKKDKKISDLAKLKGRIMKNGCKNHLNRIRNEFTIPEQLQSQKYLTKEIDDTNLNLRMKNILRFQFDHNQEYKLKSQRKEESGLGLIQGWKLENDNLKMSAWYIY